MALRSASDVAAAVGSSLIFEMRRPVDTLRCDSSSCSDAFSSAAAASWY
jgi:hypothetical protein